MPLFDYTGQLRSGQMFQGTLEADSQGHAEAMLTDMGVRVTALRPARRAGYVAPLSLDDALFFNEQLAALAKSATPLHEGLRNLAADVGSRKLKRVLLELAEDLEAGLPLEQAIEKRRERFPDQYAEVVRAGVQTGDLGGTLYGVTAHLRLKSHFRRVLLELAAYPLVVCAFAFALVTFVMVGLMPVLEDTARDVIGTSRFTWVPSADSEEVEAAPSAPFAMRCAFALSHAWPTIVWVVGVLFAALIAAFALTCLIGGRPAREFILRRLPGFAQVYWSSVLARFAHTSALAAFSGTPLPELLAASGASSGSPALAGSTRRVAAQLSSGASLESAAAGERDLPALWTCVVATASGRNELPAALEELARLYEQRAGQWVTTLRLLLGPMLLLMLGILLGGMIVLIFSTLTGFLTGMQAL